MISKGNSKALATNLVMTKSAELSGKYGEEIVEMYRSGSNQSEIAKKYSTDFNYSEEIGKSIIGRVLEKLLDEDERKDLAEKLNSDNGKRVAKIWTRDRIVSRAPKLGQISYEEKTIITDIGKITEFDYYISLVNQDLEKNKNSGKRKKIDWEEIAKKTNEFFNNNRNARKLATHYHKIFLK
jgi:hypothetical protein